VVTWRSASCGSEHHHLWKRQGGNGRSDAERLLTGRTLRRVRAASRGTPRRSPNTLIEPPSRGRYGRRGREHQGAKRDESQGWQRGATNPQPVARSKPSRWCETTRAERDARGWFPAGPSVGAHALAGSGRATGQTAKRRQRTNPRRGWHPVRSQALTGRAAVARGVGRARERFEGEAKVTRVDFPAQAGRRQRTGTPRGSGPVTVQGRGGSGSQPGRPLPVEGDGERKAS
jgi:hypothetical protein